MLRRTPAFRTKKGGFFTRLRDAYDPKNLRLKDAGTGKATNQAFDPVYGKVIHQSNLRPMRKNMANASNLETDFMQGDEVHKWMDVEQAARVLGIKKEELIGLKPARIEQAWAALYKANSNSHGKKNEVTAAAEILMAYSDSDLSVRKQREYYTRTLENMRLDIEKELDKDKAQYAEWFMQGAGVMLLIGGAIIVVVMYVKKYAGTTTMTSAHDTLGRYMNVVASRPANVEPAPDYVTRYRDTPTAIEVDRANGVNFDRTHTELAAHHDQLQASRDEDAYLLNMMNEENEQVLLEAKAARQSTWTPHAATTATSSSSSTPAAATAGSSENAGSDAAAAAAPAVPTVTGAEAPIVLPLTGKTVSRESFAPSFNDFMGTVENRLPSAMKMRGNLMLDKGERQEATLERNAAFQEVLREERERGPGNQ